MFWCLFIPLWSIILDGRLYFDNIEPISFKKLLFFSFRRILLQIRFVASLKASKSDDGNPDLLRCLYGQILQENCRGKLRATQWKFCQQVFDFIFPWRAFSSATLTEVFVILQKWYCSRLLRQVDCTFVLDKFFRVTFHAILGPIVFLRSNLFVLSDIFKLGQTKL